MTQENQSSSLLSRIITEPKDHPSFDEVVEHFHQMYVEKVDLKKESADFAKFSIKWDKTVNIEVPCASGGLTVCKVFYPVLHSGICEKAYHKKGSTDKSNDYETEIPNSLVIVERIFSAVDPATNKKFIAFTGTVGGCCVKEDGSIGPIPH